MSHTKELIDAILINTMRCLQSTTELLTKGRTQRILSEPDFYFLPSYTPDLRLLKSELQKAIQAINKIII